MCDLLQSESKVVNPENSVDTCSLVWQGHPVAFFFSFAVTLAKLVHGGGNNLAAADFNRSQVAAMWWQDLLPGRY